MTPSRTRFGLSVFGLTAVVVFLLAGCSDSEPEAKSRTTLQRPLHRHPALGVDPDRLDADADPVADPVEAVADAVGQGHAGL